MQNHHFDELQPGLSSSEDDHWIRPSHTENPAQVEKVLLCGTGKVYSTPDKGGRSGVLESKISIHPRRLPPSLLDIMKQVTDMSANAELFWVQEEHKNYGAWSYASPGPRQQWDINLTDCSVWQGWSPRPRSFHLLRFQS